MFDIQAELKKLPHRPGVYIMKDENGAIIYVGKAVNLHSRVRSYFQASSAQNPKVRSLSQRIESFEYLVTDNEVEALILECNLIKLNSPKYNVRLKDDKTYPYIKLTVPEQLPRIVFAHKREKDKAKYFGPYVSAARVHEILDLMHRIWPLRRCQRVFPRDFDKERPCLHYHIGQCKGPCHRHISAADYDKMVEEALQFVQGKTEAVAAKLTEEMTASAADMAFERAAELRDLINALQVLSEKQKADTCDGDDRDVIAIARAQDEALMQVFFVRGGRLMGREHYMLQGVEDLPESEIYAAFIKQFYGEAAFIPKELTLACDTADNDAIMEWLSGLKGKRVQLTVPQKGEKYNMVQLAAKNAAMTMDQFGAHLKRETQRNQEALCELSAALSLSKPLERIEAYDISNIQGFESVGSMVVFANGKAKNSDYRKFKIKGVMGPDDYASMEEVITRRFARYVKEQTEGDPNNNKFSKLPDLLMIDGGKGQVSAAERVLETFGLNALPVCGMVKDDRHRTRGLIYQNHEITLPRNSEGFKLITRIQDEVHRFAVEYHRKLRADAQVHSVLDDIPGIGPTRRRALMRHFKAIEPIRAAAVETLMEAPSMSRKAAEAVYAYFHA